MADSGSEFEGILTEQSEKGSMLYLYVVSLVAAVGGFLFGFDIGVISGAIPFITEHFELDVHMQGFVVSNLVIGCILGAICAGALSDRFGRKKILIFAAFLFALSAILSALPRNIIDLVIARFIGGLAVGTASVLTPIYIAEISPAGIRGRLVAINQLAIVTGIFITYLTNWLVVDIGPTNWRWMFALEALPAGFFAVALFFVPESPRFLTKLGRNDNALAILSRVGGYSHAKKIMADIQDSLEKEAGSIKEIFQPGFRAALMVGIILAVLSQWCGMVTIVYYAPTIFMKAGYESASSALLANVMIGLVNFLFTFVAIFSVDRFGRKGLLLIGLSGMFVAITLTGFIYQSEAISGKVILIPLLVFVGFYCMSIGAVTWVMLSEIFPTKIRGTAMSIATMSLWIANFILSQVFPWMIDTIEGNSFYIFGVVTFTGLIFTWKMIPETKNKTLEEIEEMWLKRSGHSTPVVEQV